MAKNVPVEEVIAKKEAAESKVEPEEEVKDDLIAAPVDKEDSIFSLSSLEQNAWKYGNIFLKTFSKTVFDLSSFYILDHRKRKRENCPQARQGP